MFRRTTSIQDESHFVVFCSCVSGTISALVSSMTRSTPDAMAARRAVPWLTEFESCSKKCIKSCVVSLFDWLDTCFEDLELTTYSRVWHESFLLRRKVMTRAKFSCPLCGAGWDGHPLWSSMGRATGRSRRSGTRHHWSTTTSTAYCLHGVLVELKCFQVILTLCFWNCFWCFFTCRLVDLLTWKNFILFWLLLAMSGMTQSKGKIKERKRQRRIWKPEWPHQRSSDAGALTWLLVTENLKMVSLFFIHW